MTVQKAQRRVLKLAHRLEQVGQALHELASALPVSEDRERMLRDEIPNDVATELYAVLLMVQTGYVAPGVDFLRDAATVTDEQLRSCFDRPGGE